MPQQEVIELRSTGCESDPEDEYFKPSTLDYLPGQVYTNWALFFKLPDDADRSRVISTLQRSLEITLSQCRQLCGIVDSHPDGDLCIHKKRTTTVDFHVQHLEKTEDSAKYPSFTYLEARRFVSPSLGDIST